MITVSVDINGHTIFARSAINTGKRTDDGEIVYLVDDGSTIYHFPINGAVPLAIELLQRIKEPRHE
jgi:hypothetical protein